tara:strand:- start:119481 stop:121691 length:2211 start_codon:yes stop_codon:yes gene_type:complete
MSDVTPAVQDSYAANACSEAGAETDGLAKAGPTSPDTAQANMSTMDPRPSATVPAPGASDIAGESNIPAPDPVDTWGDDEFEDEPVIQSEETIALIGSMLVHLIVILLLALAPLRSTQDDDAVVLLSPAAERNEEPVQLLNEITYDADPQDAIGSDSVANLEMAAASAEVFAEIAEISNPIDVETVDAGQIMVNKMFMQAAAPLNTLTKQRGKVGQGESGAAGAVDRLTFEILESIEDRPTLVVWLFDQSGSLHRQRKDIRDRFDRIYTELGIATEQKKKSSHRVDHDAPLLTSVIGFGEQVTLFTEKPTAELEEIKSIVDSIEIDPSGVERVFTAINHATDEYKSFRRSLSSRGPQRNVMFVIVTDERGDDANQLEKSIAGCRKWGIPVYVIGVPAPFGREHTFVKYVDPDPKYDQSPRWASVDQGPETMFPERVHVGFSGNFQEEPVIDSGFGPYALTRLCYETGGIYFSVHPNRNTGRAVRRSEVENYAADIKYFFEPEAMARYRPDYLSPSDYQQHVMASPLRQALVRAAQLRPATGLSRPTTRFVQVDAAALAGDLTRAQQDAAKLEPTLIQMAATLQPGMEARESETSPRWRAGFDLAMGRVLAQKVRTETYNAMLAKAKRGMSFENEKNNTWVLQASSDVSVGSKWQREAELATELLTGVVEEHPGTPWALLAKRELDVPIGWKWVEDFTRQEPPRAMNNPGNNNPPRPAKDDEKRMLKKAPTRPIPKL